MITSSKPGTKPLVSSRLREYLQDDDAETIALHQDEFDRFIASKSLKISRIVFFRDLDMLLIVLNNRQVISRQLSVYPFLHQATDADLENYVLSDSGVHWPSMDADLSLRGFLIEEAIQRFSSASLTAAA
jgi:hypothetical protein